jgi:hypothetical protein
VNRFIGYSQVVTTNNYSTLKITVTVTHKIKSSVSAYKSLLGNKSYLVITSQLNPPISKSKLCYDRRSVGQSVLE